MEQDVLELLRICLLESPYGDSILSSVSDVAQTDDDETGRVTPLMKWLRSPHIEDRTGIVAPLFRHTIDHAQDMHLQSTLGHSYAWLDLTVVVQVECQV